MFKGPNTMKKSNYMEIIGVLSLSLILTTSISVSSSLPEMLIVFSEHSRSSLELLMSIPAFAMMIIIALSPTLSRFISERSMITTGLLILGISGMVPVFFTSYEIIFLSRILLGVGAGLINTKAVSMIGERFSGDMQQKLQGIRCSMETLGQATLTLVAGQLLRFGWNYPFLIYGAAFIILLLYLICVPNTKMVSNTASKVENNNRKITSKEWLFILQSTLLGGLMVSSSVVISLRIPSRLIENGIGTAVDSATILSIATFAGFLGGLAFGSLARKLKKALLPFSLCMTATGLIFIIFGNDLVIMALGTSLCNFFITNCMSDMFSNLPEQLPKESLNTANAIVLVGCNLGSFIAPFILQIIGLINPELSAGFWTYAAVFLVIGIGILFKNTLPIKKSLS